MTGWDACLYEPNQWLRWAECHPALGGYLTLLAIIATVWSTRKALALERKKSEARARVVAFRLHPIVSTIHEDAQRALLCVDWLDKPLVSVVQIEAVLNNLALPTAIPEDIFSETWTMPPEASLMVFNLESDMANYSTAIHQASMTFFGEMPKEDKDAIFQGLRGMLKKIDTECLAIATHCTRVSERAIVPWWKRLQRRLIK